MSRFFRAAALMACALAFPLVANAHDYRAGDLVIIHPWARATPAGATVAAGYLIIENKGASADRLTGAELGDIASAVEIHQTTEALGIAAMTALPDGLPIGPGQTVALQPGGFHLMITGLNRRITAGEKVRGTLIFERAGPLAVEFAVEPAGSPGMPAKHGHSH